MVALRDLFTRAPQPAGWTELWTVLRPLGGRVTPDSLARMGADAGRLPRETLVRASTQLGRALALLDTEAHARQLTRDAWSGPGQPFGRRRFVRAMHAVLAAGPESLDRVLADPPVFRSYDAGDTPSVLARVREDSVVVRLHAALTAGGTGERFLGPCSEVSSTFSDGALKGWPSLAGELLYPFESHDPEGVWLTVTTELTDDLQDVPGVQRSGTWDDASEVAAAQLLTALGDRMPPAITHEPLHEVWVELTVPDEYSEEEGPTLDEGVLSTVAYVEASLLSGALPAGRAELLVRLTAQALLDAGVSLTAGAAATLHDLAVTTD